MYDSMGLKIFHYRMDAGNKAYTSRVHCQYTVNLFNEFQRENNFQ